MSGMNNAQVENAKDLDFLMLMYNLIECSCNYSKVLGRLLQYHKDDQNDYITGSESFKLKSKMAGRTPAAGYTKKFEIAVPLKYFSNFCLILEMPLIN